MKSITSDVLPKLSPTRYKGNNGRISVVGGSSTFHGAPYYCAISALRCGADLVSVYAHADVVTPIRCLSPEMMVTSVGTSLCLDELGPTDSLVIGPGLGRKIPHVLHILSHALNKQPVKNLIVDACALWSLKESKLDQEAISNLALTSNVILTPNYIEFKRLHDSLGLQEPISSAEEELMFLNDLKPWSQIDIQHQCVRACAELSRSFNNCIVVRKGLIDVITDGKQAFYVSQSGSAKRCGGLGDFLAGAIGAFSNFKPCEAPVQHICDDVKLDVVIRACLLIRVASFAAFRIKGHSLIATDVIEQLQELIGKSSENL